MEQNIKINNKQAGILIPILEKINTDLCDIINEIDRQYNNID